MLNKRWVRRTPGSRTEFTMEIQTMGLLGFILIITSLCMFGDLAEHDWADNKRLVLAFIFLGIGGLMCLAEELVDRRDRDRR